VVIPRPSLSRNAVARFVADGTSVLVGALSAILVARWLGPSVKGTLAALTFMTGLLSQACLLGLPEASLVRVGKREVTAQEALSSGLGATLLAAGGGAIVLLAYARLQLPWQEPLVQVAVLAACATLPLAVAGTILLHIINAQERVVSTSIIFVAISATSAATAVLFVGALDLSVLGGALGALLGSAVGVGGAAFLLQREGMHFRPRLEGAYLRPALRYGVRVETSYILTVAAARLDLLLVYPLAGRAEAGIYSIALTFGTLSGTVAAAMSYAAFPRLPQLSDEEARVLTARLVRSGLAAALTAAAGLAAVLPIFLPLALGRAYAGVTAPALLLLLGGVLWSGQWVLSRAYAARGDPSLLFSSFALNVSTMIVLDVALIPLWGSVGAALGSLVAPALGLAVCLARYRRDPDAHLMELVPRLDDFQTLAAFVLRPVWARVRR
jgi:O-antigen/teichoic acid export membrane protein